MRTIAILDEKNYEPHWPRETRPSVKAIIFKDGKLAMFKSEKFGEYNFPGGGVDAGETHLDALVREVREETGLHVLPESVREFGLAISLCASRYEGQIFEQDVFYYTCDIDPEKSCPPALEEGYETEYEYKLAYATLDEAISANEKLLNIPEIPWVRRNNAVLYELKKIHEHPEVLISAEKIAARVKELAAEISRDYAGKRIVLIGTLRGATIFLADLAREITVPLEMDFVKVSSYGDACESSGQVRLDYPEKHEIEGRDVILVEDIIDMGYTARWLREFLLTQQPASLALCALLDKPERRVVPVEIEYLGFSIPDEFVVGYGLDYAQKYRNLPYVGKIEVK